MAVNVMSQEGKVALFEGCTDVGYLNDFNIMDSARC